MGWKRAFALCGVVLMLTGPLTGCVNHSVREWALLGAASGAAAGAGVGVLISDKDLLGSPATPETGDVSIHSSSGIVGGLIVGAVFGAIMGSIVGHHRYDPDQEAYEEQQEAAGESGAVGVVTGDISDEDLGVDLGDLEGLEDDEEENLDSEEDGELEAPEADVEAESGNLDADGSSSDDDLDTDL